MNFLKRIYRGVTSSFQAAAQKTVNFIGSLGSFVSDPMMMNGFENWYDALNLNTYKESIYLFIGISMIRETVSGIPLDMYRIKNNDGEVEGVMDNEVIDLLERPNSHQTRKEFWKLSVAYYLLAGEAFWYLERNGDEGSVPTAMANMRPDNVEIVFNTDRDDILFYKFQQVDGTFTKIAPENVLHFKNIDPTNPARGVGVIRPATQRIITEREASKHQSKTFENFGRPDIAVMTKADIDEDTQEQMRQRWQKIYGKNKGSAAGFFGEDVTDLKLLNVSPQEMNFIESQNFLRDDILATLRIPKQMIDPDVNYNNSKVAEAHYVNHACLPVLDVFKDVINNKFLADVDEDKFLEYENPVNVDREQEVKEVIDLKKAGIITVNEARASIGYDEVEDGDVREQQSNPLQELSLKRKRQLRRKAKQILKKRRTLQRKFKAIDAMAELNRVKALHSINQANKSLNRGRSPVFNTPELRERYIKAFNSKIDKKAEGFKDALDVYYNGLASRVIKMQEDLGMNTQQIFDPVVEIPEARSIFEPLMHEMFIRAGRTTMEEIANGFQNKAAEDFSTPSEMLRQLDRRAEFFITSMLDTDFDRLKALILAGMEEGISVPELARRIRDYFDDVSLNRAKTIARTETGRLVSQATEEAYKQSEVVTGKEWLSAEDDRVRPEHVENNGVIVATDGTFPNGERYPGDNSINCRCALAPAV